MRGIQRTATELTCFNCHQKGHIAPNCPAKKKVKKVRVLEDNIVSLNNNEVFGEVSPHRMPITLDMGAEVTVVPAEAVEPHQLSGEKKTLRSFNNGESTGQVCTVDISLGGQMFRKQAVTQPGESLGWSVCMSLDLTDPAERKFLSDQITRRAEMSEKDALYVPPVMKGGMLVSGVLVSEARVVKAVKEKTIVTEQLPVQAAMAEAPEQHKEQNLEGQEDPQVVREEDRVVESGDEADDGAVEENSEDDGEVVLERAEVAGDTLDGRADTAGNLDLDVTKIREGMQRKQMAEETRKDQSLLPLLKLGENDREGY